MKLNQKIRKLREFHEWSQEEMAERLSMSKNGYAKIERGVSQVNLERLQQIANLFQMDVVELLSSEHKGLVCLFSENSQYSSNYYNNGEAAAEIEKLQLMLAHKDELMNQKDKEIAALKHIISLMEKG